MLQEEEVMMAMSYEELSMKWDMLIASYASLRASHERLLAAAKFAIFESDEDCDEPLSWAAYTNLKTAIAKAEEPAP